MSAQESKTLETIYDVLAVQEKMLNIMLRMEARITKLEKARRKK